METKERPMERYIQQAEHDYKGDAIAIAEHFDKYGEQHILVKMKNGRDVYYLDWIGGEYAEYPDECGEDEPFEDLYWMAI